MIKSILLLFLSFSLLSHAQYLIPDICAPGMNVYVEIIGLEDEPARYGIDGLYLNNPSDALQVRPLDAADREFFKVGPLVVSWEGRMISTQVFVNPNVQPNSNLWNQLNDEFIIPVEVVLNNNQIQVDTIFVVNPTILGDISSNPDRLFGERSLGRRSPRGAMIVDSLILADDEYKVSLIEPDADSTNGMQAYFPFILISKGPVRGTGSLSRISVDAPSEHAGPGGGGGGGRFCDNTNTNAVGGNGFTGGSGGGSNKSNPFWFTGRSKRNFGGYGTGSEPSADTSWGGSSLNGVKGAFNGPETYQSSGGGTGHPFGKSAAANGNDGQMQGGEGQYGGAGGGLGGRDGGGAGYATDGQNENIQNGGHIHGNEMGVPFAGGSGGGGGNPQTFSGCAGEGGGGGGAIRVYGSSVSNIVFSSTGASGRNSGNGDGGDGSGGFIDVSAKLELKNLSGSALSDGTGGMGRVRLDGKKNAVINFDAGSEFQGPTTDTTSFADLSFLHDGTKQSGRNVRYFIKADNDPWKELNGITDNGETWQLLVDLTDGADFYYVSLMQEVPSPSSDDYLYEPSFVMSQASANVLEVEKFPIITTVSIVNESFLACDNDTFYDTLEVQNTGTDDLLLDLENSSWSDNTLDFSVISPNSNTILEPDEKINLIVRFINDQALSGLITNTLSIVNNDPLTGKNPKEIEFNFTLSDHELAFIDEDLNITDTLDIEICSGESETYTYNIRNDGDFDLELSVIQVFNSSGVLPVLGNDKQIQVSASKDFMLEIDGNSLEPGSYITDLIYYSTDCANPIGELAVRLNVLGDSLDNVSIGKGDFGSIKINTSSQITLTFQNNTNGPVNIDSEPTVSAPFTFISSNPPIPVLLNEGDQIEITYEFAPTIVGDFSYSVAELFEINNGSCDAKMNFLLEGQGIDSEIRYPRTVDFGPRLWCLYVEDEVVIENLSDVLDITINGLARIEGADAASFSILTNIPDGTVIGTNSSVTYTIAFDPSIGADGPKTAEMIIPIDDNSEPELKINLVGTKEGLRLTSVPDTIYFGNVPVGSPSAPVNVQIFNNSNFFGRELSSHFDDALFGVANMPYFIANNSDQVVPVTFSASAAGPFTGEIGFVIDDGLECLDTFYIPVKANGVEGDLQFSPSDSLDFGFFNICNEQYELSIQISNDGDASVDISDIQIVNDPNGLFSYTPLANNTINASGSETLDIQFNGNDTYGEHSANVIITFNQNGIDLVQSVLLLANVEYAVDLPSELDFGQLTIGLTNSLQVDLTEKFGWQLVLEDISDPASNEFNVDDNSHDGLDINDNYTIDVEFIPTSVANFQDQLEISYMIDGDCVETQLITLRGEGIDGLELTLWIPDLIVDPKDSDLSIPVYGTLNSTDNVQFVIDNITLTSDRSVFYPESVSEGDFIGNDYLGDLHNIYITVDNSELSPEDSLAFSVNGTLLLGDKKITDLTLSAINIVDPRFSRVDLVNGSLELIICEEYGERLILNNDNIELDLIIINNNGILNIQMNLLEKGEHQLSLIDLNGEQRVIDEFYRDMNDPKIKSISINTNDLSTGVYFIKLRGPWRSITKKIIITE